MVNIVLIGFMGSGKSIVGEMLSKKLSMNFLDMDLQIQKRVNTSIQEIFKIKGESWFRKEELRLSEEIASQNNLVIATGGGIILQNQCMNYFLKNSIIFYLKSSFDSILNRLEDEKSRPLYDHQDIANFQKLYNSRLTMYEKFANYTIYTDNKSAEKVSVEIEEIIKKK